MMKKEALESQSTIYLAQLERWQLLRWKRRLELLNESTHDLWLIREVLEDKLSSRTRELNDEGLQIGITINREHLLNMEYGTIMFRSIK